MVIAIPIVRIGQNGTGTPFFCAYNDQNHNIMEKKLTALTLEEQKAIIRDCLEKVTYIRRTVTRFFPRVTLDINPGYSPLECCAMRIYEDYTVNMANDLADIYGDLIRKEVSHE
jgi:hypothetical protein